MQITEKSNSETVASNFFERFLLIFKRTFFLTFIVCLNVPLYVFSQNPKDAIIEGTVTNSQGDALQGVSITLKNTNIGTSTNAQGKFSLNAPAKGGIGIFINWLY